MPILRRKPRFERSGRRQSSSVTAATRNCRNKLRPMTKPLVVEQSRTIPMGQADVFRDMVPMPLPELFSKWYGPIPPIKETRDQTGDWDAVGQSRTVVL